MVEPRPNMDPDDVMATDERRPEEPPEQPISEQEGADEPRAVAQPGSPGAAERTPAQELETITQRLAEQEPRVAEIDINGQPGLAVGDVPLLALVEEDMAFRLRGDAHTKAWRLDASELWNIDAEGHDAPETEWVLVRFKHSADWPEFAEAALAWARES